MKARVFINALTFSLGIWVCSHSLLAGSLEMVEAVGSPPPLQEGAGVLLSVGSPEYGAEDAGEWIFLHHGGLRSELNARPVADVWLFGLAEQRWSKADVAAPYAHAHALVAAADGRAYAFGGYDHSGWFRDLSKLTSFEVRRYENGLEVITRPVRVQGPTPGACADAAVVAVEGGRTVLYIGGQCSDSFPGIDDGPGQLWSYSVLDNSWQRLSDLPARLHGHSAVAVQNQVWVFGGRLQTGEEVSSLYRYDLLTDTWQEVGLSSSEWPSPRYGHQAVVIGRQMLILGGIDTPFFPRSLGDIWSFDLVKQVWNQLEEYETGLARMAAVALPADPDAPWQRRALLFGGVIDPWSFPNTLSDATFIYQINIELPACSSDERRLCLVDQRFRVAAVYLDEQGEHEGQAILLANSAGAFHCDRSTEVELVVSIVDGRSINDHYWVQATALALTDHPWLVTVTDTATGSTRQYSCGGELENASTDDRVSFPGS
jgi:N-acetylneuraminic acid mutarotase